MLGIDTNFDRAYNIVSVADQKIKSRNKHR